MAKKKITDLKFDDKNFNIGSQQGNALLEKSIQKFGFREAATVDKNGVLIGGNKRTAKAGELGFEDVEIIKADPKKVYALQYDDIDIDTPEGRSLALALNATAKSNIVLDAELVEAELGEAVCEEWGVESSIKADAEEDDYEIPDTIGFGGSGTTMVACHQMNRRGRLVEFDPKYCQVIIDRMLKLDPTIEIKKNGEPYKLKEDA